MYDNNWWIGPVIEKDDEECDIKVKFLHPKGPSKYFQWPQRDDICYIPNNCVLKVIDVPVASSLGRNYVVANDALVEIKIKWGQFVYFVLCILCMCIYILF